MFKMVVNVLGTLFQKFDVTFKLCTALSHSILNLLTVERICCYCCRLALFLTHKHDWLHNDTTCSIIRLLRQRVSTKM